MCFSGKLHHRPVALNLRSLLLHSIRRFCCSVAFGLVASLSSWDLVFASKEWPMAVFVQGVHGAPGTWQDSNPQLFLSRSWKQLKSLLSRPAVADLGASPRRVRYRNSRGLARSPRVDLPLPPLPPFLGRLLSSQPHQQPRTLSLSSALALDMFVTATAAITGRVTPQLCLLI